MKPPAGCQTAEGWENQCTISVHAPDVGVNSIITRLVEIGGHFVLCNPDTPKKPAHKHWLRQPPSSAKIINWIREGGQLGLIPGSIDSVCLDCDKGRPESLVTEYPPFCQYESRTAGHRHLWYESRQPVQLYLWEYQGCSGEVISSSRFVSLPSPGHVGLLLQGMIDNPDSVFPSVSLLTPPHPLTVTNHLNDSGDNPHVHDSYRDTGIQDTPHTPSITLPPLIGKSYTPRDWRLALPKLAGATSRCFRTCDIGATGKSSQRITGFGNGWYSSTPLNCGNTWQTLEIFRWQRSRQPLPASQNTVGKIQTPEALIRGVKRQGQNCGPGESVSGNTGAIWKSSDGGMLASLGAR